MATEEMQVTPATASRQQRRALEAENQRWPLALKQIPRAEWPDYRPPGIKEVWRSRGFLVQVFDDKSGLERLSVCRTSVTNGDWKEDIQWEELQRLKRECGRGEKDAVEIFPADRDVVNVANMRHLWLTGELPFKWKAQSSGRQETA